MGLGEQVLANLAFVDPYVVSFREPHLKWLSSRCVEHRNNPRGPLQLFGAALVGFIPLFGSASIDVTVSDR
jgi:hypothetical protein